MNTQHNIQRDARLLEISNTIAKLKREIQGFYEPNVNSKSSEEIVEEILGSDSDTSEFESTMSDEELERGLNDYFDYLALKETPEYHKKITDEIEALTQEIANIVISYRQRNVAQAKNENELNCIYMREMQQMLIEHPPKTVNGKTKYGENHYSLNYLASQVFSRVKKSEFAKLIPIKDPDTKEQIDESSSLKQIVRVSKKSKII